MHYDGAKAQSCIVQKICTTSGQSLLSLPGRSKKNFSFHFKHFNLTIHVVKCRKKFCTCSPSSLGQDPIVETWKCKNVKTISFLLLELELADLKRFLRKIPLTLFPSKVLVPCKKCSQYKIVIMIFWRDWGLPSSPKPKIHCFLVGGTNGYRVYFLMNLQLKWNAL